MEESAPSYQVRPTLSVLPGVELIRVFHVFNARMADKVFSSPSHEYTQALLAAVPRL